MKGRPSPVFEGNFRPNTEFSRIIPIHKMVDHFIYIIPNYLI